MLNHQFLAAFSQNFVQQVQRVLTIDGYLIYNINNDNQAYNYHAVNIDQSSLTEYIDQRVESDPVSFRRFYHAQQHHVELLNQHDCNAEYFDFMQRWKIQDTAEVFFRKRNGDPILGISMLRQQQHPLFSPQDQNILQSFYGLSENYFYHHADSIDREYISSVYRLTKTEVTVLEQLLTGINNLTVAQNLSCSLATIKTHVQHIYQKINVNNRQELLCKFLR